MDIQISQSKQWRIALFLFGMAFFLFACAASQETPTVAPVIECPTYTAPTPVSYDVLWASSAHADRLAPAFTHWDEANPAEIPVDCAQCHSWTGFLDFLGVDGSTTGVVEKPIKPGTVITCYACHNEGSLSLDYVNFPSGKRIGGLGSEAVCINCHQGRGSTPMVENAILKANPVDEDTPSPDLAFVNSHSTSAATPFGAEAQGGYEYAGMNYYGRYMRGADFFACIRCHDQHTLELKLETCSECHTFDGVDPKNIRVNTTDFDGDADLTEGAYYEVGQLHKNLLVAIQEYARNIVKVPIAYTLEFYPYFFIDTNNNGTADPEEAIIGNAYKSWTPRLLRAAYNYNYVSHDAGAYAHNSKYILQVLFDSLVDIGADTSGLARP
jgi:hypothetical protein